MSDNRGRPKLTVKACKDLYDLYAYTIVTTKGKFGKEYLGKVVELPKIRAYGRSLEEALQNVKNETIKYLKKCEVEQIAVPIPLSERRYSGFITVRMTPEIHRELSYEAAIRDVSLNSLIVSRISRRPIESILEDPEYREYCAEMLEE